MEVKYFSNRFLDRLRPGDELNPSSYTPEHLDSMIKLGMIRREVIGEETKTAKPKKSASKKAASK